MRICLLTDTLGDINGVSRFIRDIADQALARGRGLMVLTSTRFDIPDRPNLLNFPPRAAMRMPRYPQLELVLPPARRMLRRIQALRPHAIHISTPGPVGVVGLLAARRLRLPLLGTYHTDFPAYIERLFTDDLLTLLSARAMSLFYRRFAAIFSRSSDYAHALTALGIPAQHIVRLRPGIDLDRFSPRFRNPDIWTRSGIPEGPKVLYCGRISVEKNLPMLVRAWNLLRPRLSQHPAHLVLIGDGPYRERMQRELGGPDVHFLGFRHGAELSTLYASSDLLVFPSTTDTLGQVVMEGQASGLPVLVSNIGGPKEVVRDGISGRVLPADDPHAWSAAIFDLISRPLQRYSMGAAAAAAMQPMSIGASFDHWWEVHATHAQVRTED